MTRKHKTTLNRDKHDIVNHIGHNIPIHDHDTKSSILSPILKKVSNFIQFPIEKH